MSREFCLKAKKKKELIAIILQQANRWQKLKEIVSVELIKDIKKRDNSFSESAKEMYDSFTCVEEWVLGKIQELENVSDTNVGENGNDNNVATKEIIKVTKALKREKE